MRKPEKLLLVCMFLYLWSISGCTPSPKGVTNGRIVFQALRDGVFDLYSINPDGSSQEKLLKYKADDPNRGSNYAPIASPNGKKVAFESMRDGNYEIYVYDIENRIQINLTKNRADDHSPAWSPDGKRIAFVSARDSILLDYRRDIWTNNIYVMDTDGSNIKRITRDNTTNAYGGLSWSPDGNSLAVAISSLSPYGLFYSAGIHILNLHNSSIIELPYNSAQIQGNPKWSPDGKYILYTISGSKFIQIYRMNADGTNQIDLSKDPTTYDIDPSWSPDGKYIVFSSNSAGNYYVYIMDADGSNRKQLTKGKGEDTFATWLPEP